MNVLFWGPGDFPVSFSNRDTSWNASHRLSGSLRLDTGNLFSNMKSLTNVKRQSQWLPNWSDFAPISWLWYRTWPSPNYEWCPWSICNGCEMPEGNAYHSGHLVPSPFIGLAYDPIVDTDFPELAVSFSTFHLEYPSVLSRFCFQPRNWKTLLFSDIPKWRQKMT